MPDGLMVVLIALGCSGAVAGTGALALRLTRAASLAWTASVVAVVAVAGVLAASVGTALAMFSSPHDLGVLLMVSLTAGAVSLAVAVGLGRRLSRDVAVVADIVAEGAPTATTRRLPGELRRLALRLSATRADAETAHREAAAQEAGRRQLVAWVSHDLRTPLAGLRAMAEALEDGVVDDAPTVGRYHRRIREEVERLSGMVDDLFELSRLQAPGRRLQVSRVSLRDLVAEAVGAAEPLARAAGVRLTAHDAVELPVRVDADEVGRLLANLLVNAVRHTPPDGEVRVATRERAGWAEIDVLDACGGIPAEDLPRLFEVGFRGSAARTPLEAAGGVVPTGAGLGLAIARGLVEAHGGTLAVANVDPGCRFTVALPQAGPATTEATAESTAEATGDPDADPEADQAAAVVAA